MLFSCESDDHVAKLFLELSECEIISDCNGITKGITVYTSGELNISNVPDWCRIEKGIRKTDLFLKIIISPNETSSERIGNIILKSNDIIKHIWIVQKGINEFFLNWSTFPMNRYSYVQHQKDIDGGDVYTIKGDKIFINSHVSQQIYHGNLFDNEVESICEFIECNQFTFKNLTVGAFVDGKSYIDRFEIPSKGKSDIFAEKIIKTIPFQNHYFNFDESPIIYKSYKHLNLLGLGNLGLELDELISGKSYTEAEMQKQTGLIYTYSQELFFTVMDYPDKISNVEIDGEINYLKLAYVSKITYGKTAILIVETDSDSSMAQKVVKKVLQNRPLNNNEENVKKELDFYYLFFDRNGEAVKEQGKSELAYKYVKSLKENNIIPLSFSLNKYSDNSVSELSFSVHLK